jgi:sec-independent protein translocase protein TatC
MSKTKALPDPSAEQTAEHTTPDEMTLWQHIGELRTRLFKCLLAMVVTIIITTIFGKQLIQFLAYPIGGLDKLTAIDVTENMAVFMRVSLLGGFILALPVILYEIIAFVVPGLTEKEQRGLFTAIPAAVLLFLGGVAFAFYVMLPAALPFLVDFLGIQTTPRLSNYISFVTSMLFWIGLSFETPLLIFILAKLHVVTAEALLKQWRIAVVVIAIVAAVVTPTADPINMGLLMLPLTLLYGLSIILAKFAQREPKQEAQEA